VNKPREGGFRGFAPPVIALSRVQRRVFHYSHSPRKREKLCSFPPQITLLQSLYTDWEFPLPKESKPVLNSPVVSTNTLANPQGLNPPFRLFLKDFVWPIFLYCETPPSPFYPSLDKLTYVLLFPRAEVAAESVFTDTASSDLWIGKHHTTCLLLFRPSQELGLGILRLPRQYPCVVV
jgi:hypothetical protein